MTRGTMALVDINSRGNVGKTGRCWEVLLLVSPDRPSSATQQDWKFKIVRQKRISHFLCLVSGHFHSPSQDGGIYILVTTSVCHIGTGGVECCQALIHTKWIRSGINCYSAFCIINSGQYANIYQIQVPTDVMRVCSCVH